LVVPDSAAGDSLFRSRLSALEVAHIADSVQRQGGSVHIWFEPDPLADSILPQDKLYSIAVFGGFDSTDIAAGAITAGCVADSIIWRQPADSHVKPTAPGVYTFTIRLDTLYVKAGKTDKGEDLFKVKVDTTETWEPKAEIPNAIDWGARAIW
jgi:hypothetical protein